MQGRFALTVLILLSMLALGGCADIKPLQLPSYSPPDFSSVSRPQISPLIEGKDFSINGDTNQVVFTIDGLNKLTAKVISEENAYKIIEILKQTIQVQGELIKQKDQLLIAVDLQRQYAEKGRTSAEIKMYISEVIGVILIIAIAAAAL